MATTARDVARVFEEIAPLDSGLPDDQLGFLWGDPDEPVAGVACTWCLHTASLRECGRRGLDLVICHEALWLPHQESPWYTAPAEDKIIPNRLRRFLLQRHRLTVYRSHSNWDALAEHGTADGAVAALGLEGLTETARRRFFSVQALPEPLPAAELRDRVAAGLGFDACRLFGDPEKPVHRFAFLIGGFGENQLHMPQAAMELGAEAIVLGEMSEFVVLGCLEMGLPVVETLHSVSENPGIRRQAALLADRLPEVKVQFVPSGAAAC